MKVLELFAGTRSIGKAFEERGHEVFSIEWDKGFSEIDWYADIGRITASDIIERFGKPDVIWASPDCSTFSVAAISHHRRKNPETGNLDPISEYAEFCDRVDRNVLRLIDELSPRYWFIENPRGGASENVMDEGLAKIHRHLLQVRRHENETYRHMDEPSRPGLHATVQKRRSVSRKSTSWFKDGDAGAERVQRPLCHTRKALQTYCGHLRERNRRSSRK